MSRTFPSLSLASIRLAGEEARDSTSYLFESAQRLEFWSAGPRRRRLREGTAPLRRQENRVAWEVRTHWIMETSCLRKERWRSWERSEGLERMSLSLGALALHFHRTGIEKGNLRWR